MRRGGGGCGWQRGGEVRVGGGEGAGGKGRGWEGGEVGSGGGGDEGGGGGCGVRFGGLLGRHEVV